MYQYNNKLKALCAKFFLDTIEVRKTYIIILNINFFIHDTIYELTLAGLTYENPHSLVFTKT